MDTDSATLNPEIAFWQNGAEKGPHSGCSRDDSRRPASEMETSPRKDGLQEIASTSGSHRSVEFGVGSRRDSLEGW